MLRSVYRSSVRAHALLLLLLVLLMIRSNQLTKP